MRESFWCENHFDTFSDLRVDKSYKGGKTLKFSWISPIHYIGSEKFHSMYNDQLIYRIASIKHKTILPTLSLRESCMFTMTCRDRLMTRKPIQEVSVAVWCGNHKLWEFNLQKETTSGSFCCWFSASPCWPTAPGWTRGQEGERWSGRKTLAHQRLNVRGSSARHKK